MKRPINYAPVSLESLPKGSGHLALQIGEQDCSLAIATQEGQLVNLQQNFRQHNFSRNAMLSQLLGKNQSLLSASFSTVNILINDAAFTILPNAFSDNPSNFYKHIEPSSNKVVRNVPLDEQLQIVYGIDRDILSILENTFYDFSVQHTAELLFKAATDLEEDAHIVVGEQSFNMMTMKDDRVFSVTHHDTIEPEDLTYFVLLGLDQLHKKHGESAITLSGDIDTTSAIYTSLYKYVGKVQVIDPETELKFSTDFDQSKRYHYLLLNLLNAHH